MNVWIQALLIICSTFVIITIIGALLTLKNNKRK